MVVSYLKLIVQPLRIAKYFPPGPGKLEILRTIEATSLEWTAVLNGYFADFFVAPKVKSYALPMSVAVDIPNEFAAIPGSGDVPVDFIYTFDIGKYVAALQGLPKWDKESIIIGDQMTLNELVKLAEQVKGNKFTVVHDSMDKLRSGEITELPSHSPLYQYYPKPVLQAFFASFEVMFEEGAYHLDVKGSLTEQFPEIKPRKVKELLEEAYGSA
jgi:hypothetical protein